MTRVAHPTRRSLLGTAAAAGTTAAGLFLAGPLPRPAIAQSAAPSRRFQGVRLNVATYQHQFNTYLAAYIPEFEERTGMKVNFAVSGFPVYNQQADLELSTRGSAYDVVNVTYIYASRWINAGWLTDLDAFAKDPKLTPPDWEPEDFIAGAQAPLLNRAGRTHGFAWEGGAMMMGVSRPELLARRGVKIPETFDELMEACAAVHGQDGIAAFVVDRLHHWHWPPFAMGFGGSVFKSAPDNLTPTLATPEAVRAAEYYATLLRSYGPPGVLSYTEDQARQAMVNGTAAMNIHSHTWLLPTFAESSRVRDGARLAFMPRGPAGDFPGANCQGVGIPAGARNKEAGWEFIKWMLSKELLARIVREHGHPSVCRASIVASEEYRQRFTINGQDIGAMYRAVLDKPAAASGGGGGNYMAYRTVPVFPQVGDKINRAIERIASGQAGAQAAMQQAQAEALGDLKRAGVTVDG